MGTVILGLVRMHGGSNVVADRTLEDIRVGEIDGEAWGVHGLMHITPWATMKWVIVEQG